MADAAFGDSQVWTTPIDPPKRHEMARAERYASSVCEAYPSTNGFQRRVVFFAVDRSALMHLLLNLFLPLFFELNPLLV